jgi:hypothetical protein
MDELVSHPNFWGDLPTEYTRQDVLIDVLKSNGIVKIQVPGFSVFYMKPLEGYTDRHGVWQLMAILGGNRQGEGIAGVYLVNPSEIVSGTLRMLRNSDRYEIRSFTVHFGEGASTISAPKKSSIGKLLSKEIKSLAILDKKVF